MFFSPNHLFSSCCFASEEHSGRPDKGMSELGISSVEFLKVSTLTNSSRILGTLSLFKQQLPETNEAKEQAVAFYN